MSSLTDAEVIDLLWVGRLLVYAAAGGVLWYHVLFRGRRESYAVSAAVLAAYWSFIHAWQVADGFPVDNIWIRVGLTVGHGLTAIWLFLMFWQIDRVINGKADELYQAVRKLSEVTRDRGG